MFAFTAFLDWTDLVNIVLTFDTRHGPQQLTTGMQGSRANDHNNLTRDWPEKYYLMHASRETVTISLIQSKRINYYFDRSS